MSRLPHLLPPQASDIVHRQSPPPRLYLIRGALLGACKAPSILCHRRFRIVPRWHLKAFFGHLQRSLFPNRSHVPCLSESAAACPSIQLSLGTREQNHVVEVLKTGYFVPFSPPPSLSSAPISLPSYSLSSIEGKALRGEVLALLTKGAIKLAPSPLGYYSCLFVVWKASGSWMPVIDLSWLNEFVLQTCFKIESSQSVLPAVWRGD